ncbi:hypothetical protein C1C97_011670 [Kocuria tytonis]|uniref:Uncharacterized protein n=1 Tax=Kocuria tytonis TaxID=2054280 RepID=A0A495A1N4_9MICC|nr:hypothetical protein C1C97_011670 [Kocuria tytonis]
MPHGADPAARSRAVTGRRPDGRARTGAGQSAGVCLGASVAGVGLAVAGWAGAGVGLAVVTLLAAIAAVRAAVVLRAWDEPSGSGTGTA